VGGPRGGRCSGRGAWVGGAGAGNPRIDHSAHAGVRRRGVCGGRMPGIWMVSSVT
jgi:hypothetical protein